MKRIKYSDYELGDDIPELQCKRIEHMDLVRYAGASGDFNPIHTDPDFAKEVGLGGTIAHGMYGMAQLGRMLTNWVYPDQIKSFGVKFKDMIRPGDSPRCIAKIKRKKEENGQKLLILSLQTLVKDAVCISGEAEILCE